MVISNKKTNLSDLIDRDFLQKLQDNFTKTTNLASIIIDEHGLITEPNDFTEFCLLTKSTEKGHEKCHFCNFEKSSLGLKENEPNFYTCNAGITNFSIPILLNGKPIALIIGGQVRTKKLEENFYKQIAKDIGVDEDEYLKLINKIPIATEEKIHSAAQLLFLIANSISEIIQKKQREKVIGEIIQEIGSTLDIDEIKNYFIETVCNYFNAGRCLFIDYNKHTGKFNPFRLEKLKSCDYTSLVNVDAEAEFPEFIAKIKNNKNVIIRDVKKTLEKNHCTNYRSMHTLKKINTKSDYGLAIKHQDKIMGCLVLHFIDEKRILTHDEFDFLKEIRDQVGTALYQAELYSETKQLAQREKIIRKTIEIIRKSIGINSVRNEVVREIGTFLKADRVFFADYNESSLDFSVYEDSEYKSSEKIKSFAGNDEAITQGLVEALKKFPLNGHDLIFSDLNKYLNENNINEAEIEKIFRDMGCISIIGIHINYGEFFYGDIVVTFEKERKIEDEDIEFVKTLADQAGIAIYQAKQYEKIQIQAERERISRNIIEIMRSSLDKNIIKHLFVKNIGQYFNADRVFFSDFDSKTNKFLPVEEKSEYLSSKEEKSIINFHLKNNISEEHIKSLTEKKELIIPNWDEYITKNNQNSEFVAMYKEFNIKSSYSFPVMHEVQIMGYFCVEFTNKICELSNEDVTRIRSICTQAGIAIYQSELYLKAQEALQAKNKFIYKVKNEINDPIKSILQSSKELSEFEFDNMQKKYLDNITKSCGQLLELTENISED